MTNMNLQTAISNLCDVIATRLVTKKTVDDTVAAINITDTISDTDYNTIIAKLANVYNGEEE